MTIVPVWPTAIFKYVRKGIAYEKRKNNYVQQQYTQIPINGERIKVYQYYWRVDTDNPDRARTLTYTLCRANQQNIIQCNTLISVHLGLQEYVRLLGTTTIFSFCWAFNTQFCYLELQFFHLVQWPCKTPPMTK